MTVEIPAFAEDQAVWRCSSDLTLSNCIQLAEAQPPRKRIWEQVELNLIRLSGSTTQDFRVISPHQVMEAFFQMSRSGIDMAAKAFGRRHVELRRYHSVVGTSLALVLRREGLIAHFPSFIDPAKYEQLARLNYEADVIKYVMAQPSIIRQLESMPDLQAMLESFQQYSTVSLFLEENKVPYDAGQVRRLNANLRGYLFGKGDPRMGPFLRKATLYAWVCGGTNWFGEGQDAVEKSISRSAAFVCSKKPPKTVRAKAHYMRRFLSEIVAQELKQAQKDISAGYPFALEDAFVPIDGRSIKHLEGIDLAKTYNLMASYFYCPQALSSIIYDFLTGPDSPQRYRRLVLERFDQGYSFVFRSHWVGAGFAFLENALLLGAQKRPSWQALTVNRAKLLARFRHTFQEELKRIAVA